MNKKSEITITMRINHNNNENVNENSKRYGQDCPFFCFLFWFFPISKKKTHKNSLKPPDQHFQQPIKTNQAPKKTDQSKGKN